MASAFKPINQQKTYKKSAFTPIEYAEPKQEAQPQPEQPKKQSLFNKLSLKAYELAGGTPESAQNAINKMNKITDVEKKVSNVLFYPQKQVAEKTAPILNIPVNAVLGAEKAWVDDKSSWLPKVNVLKGAVEGVKSGFTNNPISYEDTLKSAGMKEGLGRKALGLTGNIMLDPLNFVGGAGVGSKLSKVSKIKVLAKDSKLLNPLKLADTKSVPTLKIGEVKPNIPEPPINVVANKQLNNMQGTLPSFSGNKLVDNIRSNTGLNRSASDEMMSLMNKSVTKPKLELPLNNSQIPSKLKPNIALPKIETPKIETSNIGNADTFRSKINYKPNNKGKFTEFIKNAKTNLVDDLASYEILEKNITGNIASAENSLYKTARLYRGTPEKAGAIIDTELKPIIKSVEDKGYTYKDLGEYATAVHARDVNASGIDSGFTNAEIDDVISKYGTQEMESARQQLVNLSNRLLDDLSNGGVISKESVDVMRSKWKNYMPLFRSFDDDKVEFINGLGNSFANVANPVKKLKGLNGKKMETIDPIESMVKNIFQITNASERNKVGTQLSRLAEKDVEGNYIRKLSEGEEVGRKNVVTIKENGNSVKYEVPEDVYRSTMDLDKESTNIIIKALSKPASLLRAGATLAPEFAVRNPFRDIFHAFTVSKHGFNPFIDYPKALFDVITNKPIYQEFLKNNAGYGNYISMDRNVQRKALENVIKQPIQDKFVNVVSGKSLIKLLQTISTTTEAATKVGIYKRALKVGETAQEAAYQARDIMDFARSGASIREANKIVAFLNANIQGKSKLIRAIKENPLKVSARIGKAIVIPSVGVYIAQQTLANDIQKQKIKDAPDWLKDTFWLIPIPETDYVARVPKPFDLSVFANITEKTLRYIHENDKDAFDGFIQNTLKEQSIPVQITGLVPIIEGMTNYSFFRQAPIIPQREQNLNKEDQKDIYTSNTATLIAGGIRKVLGEDNNFSSPRIIDNTIQGLTGGLGRYATDAIDVILESTGLTPDKQKPSTDITQKPLLKAFLVNNKSTGKSLDQLYKEKEMLTNDKNSFNLDNKQKPTGTLLDISKLKNSQYPNKSKLDFLNDVTGKIGDISKEIRDISNSQVLTSEQKKYKLNELNKLRNNLSFTAYNNYKSDNINLKDEKLGKLFSELDLLLRK